MLRCNVPLRALEKYLVMKTKANICKSNDPKEHQEIFQAVKKSLPDLLVVNRGFFKDGKDKER